MKLKALISSMCLTALVFHPSAIAQSSPTLQPCTVSGFLGPDQQLELNFVGDDAGNLALIPFLLTYYFNLDKDENKVDFKGFTPMEGQPHYMLVSFFGAIDKSTKKIEYTNLTTRVVGFEKNSVEKGRGLATMKRRAEVRR